MSEHAKDSPLAIVTGLIAIIPLGILSGYVLQQLWGWFVVPVGLAPIGLWQANGIGTICALFAKATSSKSKPIWESLISCFLMILCAWGFGCVEHLLMGAFG